MQVAAQEAMVADQSAVAIEALQQLHELLVKAQAGQTFKPGDEAIILTNLMRLTQEAVAQPTPSGGPNCLSQVGRIA